MTSLSTRACSVFSTNAIGWLVRISFSVLPSTDSSTETNKKYDKRVELAVVKEMRKDCKGKTV
jgi:hypothetical protein